MKIFRILIVLMALVSGFYACVNKENETRDNAIDSTLQTNATAILESKLSELNAQSGQVIVMEVQTGQIKALVGLERKDSADYQPCENFSVQQPTGLMQGVSLLAALETGKVKMSDRVNVGNGIYVCKGDTVFDHNWHRGGYGEITVKQGLASGSNIATVKTMENAFGNNAQAYFDVLSKMSYGKPDSINGILQPYRITERNITWDCIGYGQSVSPIQVLTFYNAIANNGKMVQPQLYKDSVVVINPQIADKANIDSLKLALAYNVTDGLGQPAKSDKTTVAGKQGTIIVSTDDGNTMYAVEFCGYFPIDNPKYSIIVSINKTGLPASGGLMAGDVFRQIVDCMIYRHLEINEHVWVIFKWFHKKKGQVLKSEKPYSIIKCGITLAYIEELKANEIFVFGSNLQGIHGGGAARIARECFGAIMGQGVGLQGQSYAIPTMQGGVKTIKPYVDEFIKFAQIHTEFHFW